MKLGRKGNNYSHRCHLVLSTIKISKDDKLIRKLLNRLPSLHDQNLKFSSDQKIEICEPSVSFLYVHRKIESHSCIMSCGSGAGLRGQTNKPSLLVESWQKPIITNTRQKLRMSRKYVSYATFKERQFSYVGKLRRHQHYFQCWHITLGRKLFYFLNFYFVVMREKHKER